MSEINLGEYLRQEREKKNITLEQVASATKVNIRLLQALEADHFSELPAMPFVRGFVTAYARYIGLDSNEVLTRYQNYLSAKGSERKGSHVSTQEVLLERKEGERTKTMLWLVMGGFIVVGGLLMVVLKPSLRHKRVSTVEKLKASHMPEASPTSTPSEGPVSSLTGSAAAAPVTQAASKVVARAVVPPPLPSPSPSPSTSTSNSPAGSPSTGVKPDLMFKGDDLLPAEVKVKIILRAKEDCWVRYKVDGKESRRFVLRGGSQLVMKGKQAVRVQVSDPDKAEIRYKTTEFLPFKDKEGLRIFNDNPTLVFPVGQAEKEGEPFPGASPLPPK